MKSSSEKLLGMTSNAFIYCVWLCILSYWIFTVFDSVIAKCTIRHSTLSNSFNQECKQLGLTFQNLVMLMKISFKCGFKQML